MDETTTYTAQPGSRLDRAANAEKHATGSSQAHSEAHVQGGASFDMEPVPVTGRVLNEAAPEGIYRTSNVLPSGIRQLLPQDPRRVRAVVLSIDQDVVLCMSKELAQSAANTVTSVPFPDGFYLPKGTPLEVKNKGLVWVANTSTSTATRVSVVTEHADPSSHRL